ncbi:hypothetical protein ACFVJK_46355 [Streptomyces sp. NPDC127172]|uniref:hypothetical protein n=1 Tax=Streptomyces sp. NPDC127172 TaxID=3345382 RepID=UPI00363FD132
MIDVDTALSDDFPLVAADWLARAVEVVVPNLWEAALAQMPFTDPEEWNSWHGAPRTPWGEVHVWNPGRGLMETRPLSPHSLQWMAGELTGHPVEAHVLLHILGEGGVPAESGGEVIRAALTADEDEPRHAQLQVMSSLSPSWEGDLAASSHRWADFVHGIALRVDPTFGHLCDDSVNWKETGRDTAGGRRGVRRSIRLGREILRGYSWVTIVPRELASILGGANALTASGAFYRVDELPSGAVWLQTAETITGYDDAVMTRVFETLAPVLPKGEPRRNPGLRTQPRLVWRDAASV